jgi:UDP-2,4-diacetamido-2,4,6-trideoxy-beta-L-altropyranose hydrolase
MSRSAVTAGEITVPHVVIRADSSARMGGGHVMRCLTLADTLAARGARVTFVAAMMLSGLADRISRGPHQLIVIDADPELLNDAANWDSRILSAEAQRRDARGTLAAAGPASLVIIDHYRLDAAWEASIGNTRCLVIDDLANRPHRCDMLLDQTFGRTSRDYVKWANTECRLLTGVTYALLRPEFSAARHRALERRRSPSRIERVLVSLGGTDIGGITDAVVAMIATFKDIVVIDVVVTANAPSMPLLRARAADDPRIVLHVDTDRMADLMVLADLAIGAAGTTSWERCCLALPSIILILADNQRYLAAQLTSVGAAVVATTPDDVADVMRDLMQDLPAVHRMAAAAAAMVDGYGAHRVANAILGTDTGAHGDLLLRDVRAEDSERLWLWRNDPQTRLMAISSDPIAWIDHRQWFATIMADPATWLMIVEQDGNPAVMIRFDRSDDRHAVVSINVAPIARSRGLGRQALAMACSRYRKRNCKVVLLAHIYDNNPASMRIFTKTGFSVQSRNGDLVSLTLENG